MNCELGFCDFSSSTWVSDCVVVRDAKNDPSQGPSETGLLLRSLLCSLQPPSAKAFYTTGGACEVGGFSLGADAPESHPKQLQGFRFLRLLRVPVFLAMAYDYICMASERMYAFIYE